MKDISITVVYFFPAFACASRSRSRGRRPFDILPIAGLVLFHVIGA